MTMLRDGPARSTQSVTAFIGEIISLGEAATSSIRRYTSCVTVDDCDPVTADACVHQGPKSWCTVICKTDSDCPIGPRGEKAVCRDLGKAKVCSLP